MVLILMSDMVFLVTSKSKPEASRTYIHAIEITRPRAPPRAP